MLTMKAGIYLLITSLFFLPRTAVQGFQHAHILQRKGPRCRVVNEIMSRKSDSFPSTRRLSSLQDSASENVNTDRKYQLSLRPKFEKEDRKALLSAASFCVIDAAARAAFQRYRLTFPSPLAACSALFVTLLLLPKKNANSLFEALSPGAKLLAKWLPVFFVPSLITLPLAGSFGSATELIKVMFVITGGFLFSLSTTAWSVNGIRKITSKAECSGEGGTTSELLEDVQEVAGEAINAAKNSIKEKMQVKVFSNELFSTLGALTVACGAGSLAGIHPVFKPLFMLFTTLSSFVLGTRMPGSIRKLIHPLVTCTAMSWMIFMAFAKVSGSSFRAVLQGYKIGSLKMSSFAAGDVLLYLLGPAVVSLAVSMYERRKLMRDNLSEVVTSIVVSTFGGLFGTAALVRFLEIANPTIRLSLLSRNITSPLAMAIAGIVGGDLSLAVSMVVITGLIGANFGATILDILKVNDPIARGLSMGAAAHGLGTAALASSEEEAFPFAAIAMALTASAATVTVSISFFQRLLLQLALG